MDDSLLACTRWRRKSRKRRKLKIEKVIQGDKGKDSSEGDQGESSEGEEERDDKLPSDERPTKDVVEKSDSPVSNDIQIAHEQSLLLTICHLPVRKGRGG